jgi:hypothetical protein
MMDACYYTECRWCEGEQFVTDGCGAQHKRGYICTREGGHEGKHVACTGHTHSTEEW